MKNWPQDDLKPNSLTCLVKPHTSNTCMCMNYHIATFTSVEIVKHVKDTMRDNSCITQLGQSISGAAGSSSRQMENVLAPLHAWTHSPPSSANTNRSLANLRHNFKGTWFWEPVNRAGPGCSAQIETWVWKWEGTVVYIPSTHLPPTVPAPNEAAWRLSVSPFVLLIFHLPKFPRFCTSPRVLIHRAHVPLILFTLGHPERGVTPQPHFSLSL